MAFVRTPRQLKAKEVRALALQFAEVFDIDRELMVFVGRDPIFFPASEFPVNHPALVREDITLEQARRSMYMMCGIMQKAKGMICDPIKPSP